MLGIIICEDNIQQRVKIRKIVENKILIDELDVEARLITDSPYDVIDHIKKSKEVNIYFLDIDLQKDINGIELAVEIRKYDPRGFIVFITTHSEMTYLTFKYKVEAMDFILKDNVKEIDSRVRECINDALNRYGKIKEVESNLDSRFYRCHRAFIINKESIVEINRSERYALMRNGEKCYISARQISNF